MILRKLILNGNKTMKHLDRIIAIAEFLGDNITSEQSAQLMDEARQHLSIAEMEILKDHAQGDLYTSVSMYEGEMGGFARYY
jgi:hypothetical protein